MQFSYIAKDAVGKTIKGTDEANSKDDIITALQARGYFIVSIQPAAGEPTQKLQTPASAKTKSKGHFTHHKVKLDDLLIFARQLATMIASGITLLRSIQIAKQNVDSKQLAAALEVVESDVERGISFSASLSRHPKIFNQFWVSLAEVGEASGTMPAILEKLAFYLEQRAAFQSALISAIIYPAILFCVAIGAITFFALVIGPRFEALFQSFNTKLPLPTQVILDIFRFLRTNFLVLILAIGAILLLMGRYIKTPMGKQHLENFIFSLPKAGYVYRTIVVERFTSQMSILTESGVPILYALDIAQRMVDNLTCAAIIGDIKNNVREGKLLAEPMEKSRFFPPMTVQMIKVGEETGELGKMLKSVADYYQAYVQTFMKRFATLFEPFMLVFMGGVIGTIVISLFLPIFKIAQLGTGR